MNLFRFESPWWLAVILPLVIIAIWRWTAGRRRGTAVTYSSVDLLLELPRTFRQHNFFEFSAKTNFWKKIKSFTSRSRNKK